MVDASVTRGGLFSIPSRGSRGSGCSLIFGAERGALVVGKKLPGSIKKDQSQTSGKNLLKIIKNCSTVESCTEPGIVQIFKNCFCTSTTKKFSTHACHDYHFFLSGPDIKKHNCSFFSALGPGNTQLPSSGQVCVTGAGRGSGPRVSLQAMLLPIIRASHQQQ